MSPQLDHNMALMIPAGADRFKDIGRPRGGVDDNLAVGLQVGFEAQGSGEGSRPGLGPLAEQRGTG